MHVYLATAPNHYREAVKYHHRIAHAAYRIGTDSHLLRQTMPANIKCGILILSDRNAPAITHPEQLCREILQECLQRNFRGVLADFEEKLTGDRLAFLRQLSSTLPKNNQQLFVPEHIAKKAGGIAVICTALSGGNLKERLQEAANCFGHNQIVLDLERLCMEFTLPCPSGNGKSLHHDQLQAIVKEHSPLSFYSPQLATKYFTYSKNGTYRFVLYDDAHTIREKIRLGHSLGISIGFLMYPEVDDLLPQVFAT